MPFLRHGSDVLTMSTRNLVCLLCAGRPLWWVFLTQSSYERHSTTFTLYLHMKDCRKVPLPHCKRLIFFTYLLIYLLTKAHDRSKGFLSGSKSVSHTLVFCRNRCTYREAFFNICWPKILVQKLSTRHCCVLLMIFIWLKQRVRPITMVVHRYTKLAMLMRVLFAVVNILA